MNTLIFINLLFAAFAVVFGLSSRNLPTSAVAGLFIGLIHAGIVALHAAQSHAMPVSDLPYVKDALDAAMATGEFTFHNARTILYLAGSAVALMAATIVCFFVRWIVCRIACSLTSKQDAATQG